MKVLLFTHKNDIDGIGNIVLGKLAFEEIDYITCETFDINKKFKESMNSGAMSNYDKIYVTDLCLKDPILTEVDKLDSIKNKLKVIDHHKSEIDECNDAYDFINVTVKNNHGKCAGTSLFYEELQKQGYLKANKFLDDFVELTRQYDTWEWKNIYNNETSNELSILFDLIGIEAYVKSTLEKNKNSNKSFEFTEYEKNIIKFKKNIIETKVKGYAEGLSYLKIDDYNAGIAFIDYEYRNYLAEYLRKENYDIDFVMMISLDRNNISYRQVKAGVDVSKIASSYGGKGHKEAGANPISLEKKAKVIKLILEH